MAERNPIDKCWNCSVDATWLLQLLVGFSTFWISVYSVSRSAGMRIDVAMVCGCYLTGFAVS
uniref:MFS domain-containing protein n=1 Tax=Mesocestoides corti TaxID=53468 RepID=A0A5K3G0G2_MESCO